jgi:hypothetical protein
MTIPPFRVTAKSSSRKISSFSWKRHAAWPDIAGGWPVYLVIILTKWIMPWGFPRSAWCPKAHKNKRS